MDKLEELFVSYTGRKPDTCIRIAQSGSNRRYCRFLLDGKSYIGATGTDSDENHAFITIANHFMSKGIRVPKILAVSDDELRYIQEDFGDSILYERVSHGRAAGVYSDDEEVLLRRAMAALPKIQFEGADGLDFSVCYPDREFNARMVDFDLNYFKYCFLKNSGVEFNEVKLQDDFDALKTDLLKEESDTFMYRDFQARNVMLDADGQPCFIDFQGGRKGPVYYDVASFVWQAKSRYPEDLKRRLIDSYLGALSSYIDVERDVFMEKLRRFVLFRTLQVLGAYGFRGLVEKKAHFMESIPYAIANLEELLRTPFTEYPYLNGVLSGLVAALTLEKKEEDGLLEVHVISFSFKKGLPEDRSGNGGGYIFDCRYVHNPGRYEKYRRLTGLDKEVQDFLEQDGEIYEFLKHVFSLVDAHVDCYTGRGFTHLQVAFGCTGGQHRSAYSAQKLAEHLAGRPGVKVHLTHRELGIDRML